MQNPQLLSCQNYGNALQKINTFVYEISGLTVKTCHGKRGWKARVALHVLWSMALCSILLKAISGNIKIVLPAVDNTLIIQNLQFAFPSHQWTGICNNVPYFEVSFR
jgi:hypothetical protein